MLRVMLAFVALLLVLEISPGSSAVSRLRVRRGYNSGGGGGYGGYGTSFGSDERDASVSNEGCNSGEETRSYGGGGRELSYMRDRNDRQKDRGHGSRSFTKASASASASAYSQNEKLRL